MAVALAPSLLWLWYFWRQDRNTREGAGPLARAFLLGALSTIPAVILELIFMKPGGTASWFECIFVIGLSEELCKFLATKRAIANDPGFDEPADGIVAASAAALGFAFAENLGYFAKAGPGLVVVRTLLSVPGHVLWAVSYGAAIGRARFVPGTPASAVPMALAAAALLHGLFDGLLFHAAANPLWMLLGFAALVKFQWQSYRKLVAETAAEGRELADVRARTEGVVAIDPSEPLDAGVVVIDGSGPAAAAPGMESLDAAPAAVSPLAAPVGAAATGFRWGSVASAFAWGVFSVFTLAFGYGFVTAAMKIKTNDNQSLVIFVVGLVLGGLISAYRSPGRTVNESAFGLFLLGFGCGMFGGPLAGVLVGIPMGLLGAFGGWLGEALQDMERPTKP